DVMILSVSMGLRDYTREAAEEALGRFWQCAEQLSEKGANRIVQIGVPPAAFVGRDYMLDVIAETERRYGVPGGADLEMMIDGMHQLGVRSVALGGLGWPEEVNLAIADYLADAGIEVSFQMVCEDRANTLEE